MSSIRRLYFLEVASASFKLLSDLGWLKIFCNAASFLFDRSTNTESYCSMVYGGFTFSRLQNGNVIMVVKISQVSLVGGKNQLPKSGIR